MKRMLLFLPTLLMLSFSTAYEPLSKKEKDFATKFLKDTEQAVFDAVKGLNEAQLKFKAAPHKWSVEDCVKHIAMSEKGLWTMVEGALKLPPNPEKRSEIKMTDEQLIKGVEDRTNKAQAPEALKPENIPFKSTQEALDSFLESREKLIKFVNESNEDMRNHVAALPMGTLDAYQLILLISSHTNRHTQQLNEVKADPNFPKSKL